MGLLDFFTPEAGQRRRAWLDDQSRAAGGLLDYYLGPTGVPDKVKAAAGLLDFTDAGDMPAAADASRELWNNPSIGSAANYAAAGAALALPMYSARMGQGIADLADDAVKAYNPNVVSSVGPKPRKGLKSYPVAPRDEWYGDANYQATGGRMETMNPQDFLDRVRPLELDDVAEDNIEDLMNHMQSGRTLDPLQISAAGKEDGRHRAIAAQRLGINEVPVLMWGEPPSRGLLDGVGKPSQPKGIRAYHGSPHEFDRFQMDKIGTGEGAQAYGHGLYFAENEDVARSYRDTLASKITVDGQTILDKNKFTGTGIGGLDDRIVAYNGDMESVVGELRSELNELKVRSANRNNPYDAQNIAETQSELAKAEDLLNRGSVQMQNTGSMYEVNIKANPDDFLDWDAPLSEQPGALQDMARDADLSGVSSRMRNTFAHWRGEYDPPAGLMVPEPTGNDLHSLLTDFGTDSGRNADLTKSLVDRGIPGIKYRDQGSRSAEQGTRNYVVFDENLVEIVRKYGIAGAAAVLGVSAMDVQSAIASGNSDEQSGLLGQVGN